MLSKVSHFTLLPVCRPQITVQIKISTRSSHVFTFLYFTASHCTTTLNANCTKIDLYIIDTVYSKQFVWN